MTEDAGATILVVDDHDGSRYATVRTLKAAGFQTVEAATGAEAIQTAAGAVDLVVLDVNLPDIDGFEVCRELRKHKQTVELPIVHLSATFTNSADLQLGKEAGADSYLTHPADPTALIATVRALLFAREAHAARRAANARFRAIFDGAPTGVAMLDHALCVVDANRALCDLFGRDRSQVVGRPLVELLAVDQHSALASLHAALESTRSWHGLLHVCKDSDVFDLEWSVNPDPDGPRFIAMATDITQRRLLETRLQRSLASERAARAEAELSNELKDQFLATLSHELRNPLGAILGWSRVLKRMPDLQPHLVQGVDAIERNAQLQSHLISDLLDFAGIRFGKMRLELETFDPEKSVIGAVETIQHQAQQKNIVLHMQACTRVVSVIGDPSRLQQIVWNLLTNAIKFTPAGGAIHVSTTVDADMWQVTVADNGAGISPEFLPRLFDRFSQQDSTKSKSFGGLGIGLSIVRHLVEMHGGKVHVNSEGQGKGTTFTVRLPLSASVSGPHPALDASGLQGIRVLVVEDGDDTRALIVRLLSEAGAEVLEAANADAAMAQVRVASPHVLISDIGMAKTDGYTLMRALRAQGYSAESLPAVALTAFVGDEDRQEALDAGFQAHLGKPVNAGSLVSTVSRLARDRQRA